MHSPGSLFGLTDGRSQEENTPQLRVFASHLTHIDINCTIISLYTVT
jgi:hypothetical protein